MDCTVRDKTWTELKHSKNPSWEEGNSTKNTGVQDVVITVVLGDGAPRRQERL